MRDHQIVELAGSLIQPQKAEQGLLAPGRRILFIRLWRERASLRLGGLLGAYGVGRNRAGLNSTCLCISTDSILSIVNLDLDPPHLLTSTPFRCHNTTKAFHGSWPRMTTPDIDISQLSELQRDALEQYISVTAQAAIEAIPILQRSQWNVQVCYAST